LANHGRNLLVEVARERSSLCGIQVVAGKGCVDREHLDVRALLVHVFQPLFGRVAYLGRREMRAHAAADDGADAFAGLVPVTVPVGFRVNGFPQRTGHHVRVYIDGSHESGSPGESA
jgi:hypothetical protein